MLRIDINILFTVINLLVLYALMRVFLFGRIEKVLQKRADLIRKNMDDAEKSKADAEKAKADIEEQRAGIAQEREKVLADSRQQAQTEYARIVKEAGDKADAIVEEARRRAERDAEDQKKDTMDHMADLVVDATWKLAAKNGTPDSHLYDRFTEQLKKDEAAASGE